MDDDGYEDGLLDEDPALDYIIYEDMTSDERAGKQGQGCLGFVAIVVLPIALSGAWFLSV